jgi:hypothetical protein
MYVVMLDKFVHANYSLYSSPHCAALKEIFIDGSHITSGWVMDIFLERDIYIKSYELFSIEDLSLLLH